MEVSVRVRTGGGSLKELSPEELLEEDEDQDVEDRPREVQTYYSNKLWVFLFFKGYPKMCSIGFPLKRTTQVTCQTKRKLPTWRSPHFGGKYVMGLFCFVLLSALFGMI